MSHYAKLAAIALRVVSIILFIYALVGLLFVARMSATVTPHVPLSVLIMPALGGMILAIILYAAAPMLGRFAASGLNGAEQP